MIIQKILETKGPIPSDFNGTGPWHIIFFDPKLLCNDLNINNISKL